MFALYDYQLDAIERLRTGCVLNGGVGSGKSLTSLGYYYLHNGGKRSYLEGGDYAAMLEPKDLYIITTARKRDSKEWQQEMQHFGISTEPEYNIYSNKVVVDSWNNIEKYAEVKNAFFIFDEQRLVGYGAWAKAFLKIARIKDGIAPNEWILLTGTPGDTMMDYMTLFIANGWFKNKTDFVNRHVVYDYRSKYPKIKQYLDEGRLNAMRRRVLVDMDFRRETVQHHIDIWCTYNKGLYKEVSKRRWNPYEDRPIESAGELCYIWRRISNTDDSRQLKLLEIFEDHPRLIVFYNFDYELDILRECFQGQKVAEWNGHKHEMLPNGKSWVYLVQYTAGAEAWNCITTDTIVFFSPNYSYKIMTQAAGRIDRANTPYTHLYYYHLRTRSGIDMAIQKAYNQKKNFNEAMYVK